MIMLREVIGMPAMLEQTAEECSELAQACLKLARILRNENPAYITRKQAVENLTEETADVAICLGELVDNCFSASALIDMIKFKEERMADRLSPKEVKND